jgi:hypothetical protein
MHSKAYAVLQSGKALECLPSTTRQRTNWRDILSVTRTSCSAQAFSALASEGAAKVAAQGQNSSQQLASAVQELQGSTQALQSAAADSHKADSALASSLASAAASVGKEASGAQACMQAVSS